MCLEKKRKENNHRTPSIRVLRLTLRTLHTGGALTRSIAEHVRAPSTGRITHEDTAKDTRPYALAVEVASTKLNLSSISS